MSPEICPHCGAEVPKDAKACPECGSDERTGWSEEAATGGLDLPEEHFDYEDFVEREFGAQGPVPRGVGWFWWAIGLALLIALLMVWVLR